MTEPMRVSISSVRLFKACRRAWELRYVHNLVPRVSSEALETGRSYHSKLQELYDHQGLLDTSDLSKESAMADAYLRYVYPHFRVERAEDWVEYPMLTGDVLVGRVDGRSDGYIVEHKTTSAEITEEYEYRLQWNEQMLAYMLATGTRKVYYTVCRKPTIRQRKGEDDAEFFQRMREWYDVETDSKIRVLEIERTDQEVRDFEVALYAMLAEMRAAESSGNYYRNSTYCTAYGRMCEYAPICLHYDPDQYYVEFERRDAH